MWVVMMCDQRHPRCRLQHRSRLEFVRLIAMHRRGALLPLGSEFARFMISEQGSSLRVWMHAYSGDDASVT